MSFHNNYSAIASRESQICVGNIEQRSSTLFHILPCLVTRHVESSKVNASSQLLCHLHMFKRKHSFIMI